MTEIEKLSPECEKIVRKFIDEMRRHNIFKDAYRTLAASLYRYMPFIDVEAWNYLSGYMIPLMEEYVGLNWNEVNVLKAEYNAVICECFKNCDPYKSDVSHINKDYIPLPGSLVDLCNKLCVPESGSSVLLPFAGEGGFLGCCNGCVVEGFEVNGKIWALSKVYASAVNRKARLSLIDSRNRNSFVEGKKYDYIFTFPPIEVGRKEDSIANFIRRIIVNNLNENGEFYAFLPMMFCTLGSAWYDVRKILTDFPEDFSATVIALPSLLQPITSVKLCLVRFKRDHKGDVLLVDASSEDFVAKREVAGKKYIELKVQSVVETIEKQDERHVWRGETRQLKTGAELTPPRYLFEQNLPVAGYGERLIKLSDIVSLEQSIQREETTAIPVIEMKGLSSSYLNCDINTEEIQLSSRGKSEEVTKDCLLACYIGGKLKVGRLHGVSPENRVKLGAHVIAFQMKSEDVTEDFLLRALMTEESERQAKMLSQGGIMSWLSSEDFMSIRIIVPPIERQKRLCEEDTRAILSESDRRIIETHEEFRRDMHIKKHAIGQTIFSLNNCWKVLQIARKEGNGVVCDSAMVGKTRPISVSEIYDNMQHIIEKLQLQISRMDRGNGLVRERFALTTFIEEYIAKNKSPRFRYLYDHYAHHIYSNAEEFKALYGRDEAEREMGLAQDYGADVFQYVDFPPEALTIIFDNIVSNAVCHGFDGREDKENYIKIEFTTVGDKYIVEISNNGNPLHKEFTSEDVFTYSKSTKNGREHYGIGGYEVQRLMREFGGDAEFISEPEAEFPVTYRLIFPTDIKIVQL